MNNLNPVRIEFLQALTILASGSEFNFDENENITSWSSANPQPVQSEIDAQIALVLQNEENEKNNKIIFKKLDELGDKSSRALRAIALNTATKKDLERLASLDAEAVTLRAKLK